MDLSWYIAMVWVCMCVCVCLDKGSNYIEDIAIGIHGESPNSTSRSNLFSSPWQQNLWFNYCIKFLSLYVSGECRGWNAKEALLPLIFQTIIIMSILPEIRPFTANSGTKAAVQLKGWSSIANSGTQASVLVGMDTCGNFPFHSLVSICTGESFEIHFFSI